MDYNYPFILKQNPNVFALYITIIRAAANLS